MRVAYLANEFPTEVEPYVGEEIEELRGRGVEVIAGSARKGEGATGDVLYLQPARLGMMLRAARLCVRRRSRITDLLKRVLFRGKEDPRLRVKALLHTWLGAYYAVLLEERGVDHIHAHHGYFGSWMAMVAARLLNVGFSMTLHGSDLLLHGAYLDAKLEACEFCLTISEYNREHILERFPEIEAGKVIVSRLGVDVPARPNASKRIGGGRDLTLLAVGRLHAVKNHAFLVEGCARLRDRGVDCECLIAGEGPERRQLEALVKEQGLEDRVTLLGHVPRNQMDSLYGRADLVVLTSRSEGIPLVLMEAMARERIVLAPAITGIPELVIPGKTGFLYEPGWLDDFVERIVFIQALMQPGSPVLSRRLEWMRHAARLQVLHNFHRKANLHTFADRFLELTGERDRSSVHADSLLQQIQLSLQRNGSVPVRGDGTDALARSRGGAVLHGGPAREADAV